MAEKHAKVHVDNIKAGKTNHQLRDISALAHEALHAFKKESSLEKIGKLLNLGWQIKRKLAENITADWMDDLYSTAISEGAFGGKLMGAGGGGFLLFEKVRGSDARFQEMMQNVYIDYKIDNKFSYEEIINKSMSLKGVLEPFSRKGNLGLLRRAGFEDIETIFRFNCFEGYIAIK